MTYIVFSGAAVDGEFMNSVVANCNIRAEWELFTSSIYIVYLHRLLKRTHQFFIGKNLSPYLRAVTVDGLAVCMANAWQSTQRTENQLFRAVHEETLFGKLTDK